LEGKSVDLSNLGTELNTELELITVQGVVLRPRISSRLLAVCNTPIDT
jgi:hypothetical protein